MILYADDKVKIYTSNFYWTSEAFSASPLAIGGICFQNQAKIKYFKSACVYSAFSAVNLIFILLFTAHLFELSSSKHGFVQGEHFPFPITTVTFCAFKEDESFTEALAQDCLLRYRTS